MQNSRITHHASPVPNPWRSLLCFPSLCAVPYAWRVRTGELFPAFQNLFLDKSTKIAKIYTHCHLCGCAHNVIPSHDGTTAIAACACDPPRCPAIPLTRDDITGLELNLPRLGRTLAKTLGLVPKYAELPPPATFQFGAWSTDAVPAILTVHYYPPYFRQALAEVAALLSGPFILVAPTNDFLDAPCRVMLDSHRAAFFALENTVTIKPDGTLQPVKPPGELFAQFTPQPKEIDQTVGERAVALIEKLESERPLPPPTIMTVFRLYCIRGRSISEVARDLECSRTTIFRRLQAIRAATGVEPEALRRFSPHFAKIEAQISDPRAKRIYRKNLIDDEDRADPSE